MTLSIAIVAIAVFELLSLRFSFDSRNTRSAGLSSSWRSNPNS